MLKLLFPLLKCGRSFSGAAIGPALTGTLFAEPLFCWVIKLSFVVITSEPNFQTFLSTNHTPVFFFAKTYVWGVEHYAQIVSNKLIQFVVMAALR